MPKILIVDDEPHIRLLLEQSLEGLENAGRRVAVPPRTGSRRSRSSRRERPELAVSGHHDAEDERFRRLPGGQIRSGD